MFRRGVTQVSLALLVTASGAIAQQTIHVEVGGGVAIPTGMFTRTYTPQMDAMAALIMGEQETPIGGRLDYSYLQFHGKRTLGRMVPTTTMHIVTADIVATLPADYIQPYAVAGLGWYPYREPTDGKYNNDIGGNIGAGLTFPCIGGVGFIEGRFHHVLGRSTAQEFLPITIGVVF